MTLLLSQNYFWTTINMLQDFCLTTIFATVDRVYLYLIEEHLLMKSLVWVSKQATGLVKISTPEKCSAWKSCLGFPTFYASKDSNSNFETFTRPSPPPGLVPPNPEQGSRTLFRTICLLAPYRILGKTYIGGFCGSYSFATVSWAQTRRPCPWPCRQKSNVSEISCASPSGLFPSQRLLLGTSPTWNISQSHFFLACCLHTYI